MRAFHDAVLRHGAVPLDVLGRHIDAWIEESRHAHPAAAARGRHRRDGDSATPAMLATLATPAVLP